MKIKQLIKLNKFEYYKKHFLIVNNLLPIKMTDKEIDVVSIYLSSNDKSFNRKEIKQKLNLSDQSLSNYITSLLKKNVLYKDDNNVLHLKEFLIPDNDYQEYQIIIVNNNNFKALK